MELYRIEEKEKTIPDYSFFTDNDNEFELIEEQQDIDIQEIKEIEWNEINGVGDECDEFILTNNEKYICSSYDDPEMVTILKINELIKAVKQLDRKIKE